MGGRSPILLGSIVLPGGGLELLCFRLRFAFADVFNFVLHFHPTSQQIFVVPPLQKTGFGCFLKVLVSRNVSAVFVLVGLVVAVVYETNIVLIQNGRF